MLMLFKCLAITATMILQMSAYAASERIALVIGNSKYSELGVLPNTINDARGINKSLVEMGYKTRLVLDATESSLRKNIRNFAAESENSSIALVYYAGHGGQVGGENYLLPVDIDIPKRESDIQLSAIKVDDIINSLRSKTKIIFLDACRDNPALIRSLSKGRGSYRGGLAPASSSTLNDQSGGIFIAYATDAGNVALDGAGQSNSPFTTALLRHMKQPVSIDDMFSMVTRDVRAETKNQQKPYKYASLDGIICLPGTCSKVTQSSTADAQQVSANATPSIKTKIPDDWVLHNSQLQPDKKLVYIKPSSVKRVGDRVSYSSKFTSDTGGRLSFLSSAGTNYNITDYVGDCNSYQGTAYQYQEINDGVVKINQKYGIPETMNLTADYSQPGTIGYSALQLACNTSRMHPLISSQEVNIDDWEKFMTLGDGADVYFLRNSILESSKNELITKFAFKNTNLADLKSYVNITTGYEAFSNAPKVSYLISKNKFLCKEGISYQLLENYLDENGKITAYSSYQEMRKDAILRLPKNSPGGLMDQLSKLVCK
jgi:hypothetical protein